MLMVRGELRGKGACAHGHTCVLPPLCTHMHVFMHTQPTHTFMHTCMCTHTCATHTHKLTHTRVYSSHQCAHVYACTRTHSPACTHSRKAHTWVCTCTRVHSYKPRMRTPAYTCAHNNPHEHTLIHSCKHSHTCAQGQHAQVNTRPWPCPSEVTQVHPAQFQAPPHFCPHTEATGRRHSFRCTQESDSHCQAGTLPPKPHLLGSRWPSGHRFLKQWPPGFSLQRPCMGEGRL